MNTANNRSMPFFVALIVQAAAMEVDMWLPAIFAGTPGRSGGFAQNPNDAAFVVTALAALLCPCQREKSFIASRLME